MGLDENNAPLLKCLAPPTSAASSALGLMIVRFRRYRPNHKAPLHRRYRRGKNMVRGRRPSRRTASRVDSAAVSREPCLSEASVDLSPSLTQRGWSGYKERRAAGERPRKSFQGCVGRGARWRGDARSPARASRSGTTSATPTIRPNGAICPICSEQASSRMRLARSGCALPLRIRTIEHKGGIDVFLRDTPDRKLSPEIRRLKRRIAAAAARRTGDTQSA